MQWETAGTVSDIIVKSPAHIRPLLQPDPVQGYCSLSACVTAEEEEDEAAISEGELARKLQEPGYFGALQLLCNEAGFLVDSKAHKMLSSLPKHGEEGPTHSDQGLIQAGSVIKALGVTDGASFEALMAALTVAEPEGMGSQTMAELTLIHPADAVTRLREFVESENGAGTASHIGLAGALSAPNPPPSLAPPSPQPSLTPPPSPPPSLSFAHFWFPDFSFRPVMQAVCGRFDPASRASSCQPIAVINSCGCRLAALFRCVSYGHALIAGMGWK